MMLTSRDGWAVGTHIEVGDQVTKNPVILHFDGATWTQTTISS